MVENNNNTPMTVSQFTDAVIGLGLIAALVVLCFQVFTPFIGIMLWALILAVTLYPAHQGLAHRMGERQGRSATVIVMTGLVIIGAPMVILGTSLANHLAEGYHAFQNDTIHIKAPDPSVAEWPVIGEKAFSAWTEAAANLPQYIQDNKAGLQDVVRRVIAVSANTMSGVFMFLGAIIIAGIMMAYGQAGAAAMGRISSRFLGKAKGPALITLSTLTVRSVAAGVLGVAFIQALILGVGFIFSGVPAAGILAVAVLLVGIVQLPALVVSIPVVVWIWGAGDGTSMHNLIWTIYLLVGGTADNFLKPLLLGRGVDAPMPVILIGALGGMVSAGIIGLFVGAVLLAVGYQLFMEWVDNSTAEEIEEAVED